MYSLYTFGKLTLTVQVYRINSNVRFLNFEIPIIQYCVLYIVHCTVHVHWKVLLYCISDLNYLNNVPFTCSVTVRTVFTFLYVNIVYCTEW